MSLLKNLFGDKSQKTEFEEGDIFYSFLDNKYQLYKLLKVDADSNTYHVMCYAGIDALPKPNEVKDLEVLVYHAPIDKDGFEKPVYFYKQRVTADDLTGYHEYLKQTHDAGFLVALAKKYYQSAYQLTDAKKHDLAIDEYSKAIDLIPQFFEAIDNKAFCKMDLGRWADAIEDFEASLVVNPRNFVAEFSIGECYLRLKDGVKAKEHLERAIAIDPTHPQAKEFLKKAVKMIS
jgi:tetratricopeptide (TPR) repeat protein